MVDVRFYHRLQKEAQSSCEMCVEGVGIYYRPSGGPVVVDNSRMTGELGCVNPLQHLRADRVWDKKTIRWNH